MNLIANKITFTALFGLSLLLVSDAFGEPRTGGLSQLEFDRGAKSVSEGVSEKKVDQLLKKESLSEDDREALEELNSLIKGTPGSADGNKKEEQGETKNKDKVDTLAKKPLVGQALAIETHTVPADDQTFIPPSLKGPKIDKDNANSITSIKGWQPANSSCETVLEYSQVYDRSAALEEVISRFVGVGNFIESPIAEVKCKEENFVCVVTDVVLQAGSTVKISPLASIEDCHMRLRRQDSDDAWLALRVGSYSCSCVPNNFETRGP